MFCLLYVVYGVLTIHTECLRTNATIKTDLVSVIVSFLIQLLDVSLLLFIALCKHVDMYI